MQFIANHGRGSCEQFGDTMKEWSGSCHRFVVLDRRFYQLYITDRLLHTKSLYFNSVLPYFGFSTVYGDMLLKSGSSVSVLSGNKPALKCRFIARQFASFILRAVRGLMIISSLAIFSNFYTHSELYPQLICCLIAM